MKNNKEIFTNYWLNNYWGNAESKSGDGSTLRYTEHIRKWIPVLIKNLGVISILDAPCGDFNWFKEVKLEEGIKYIGGDIVDELVKELRGNYREETRRFIVLDVVSDELPDVDMWICRDLVFHLPSSDVFKLLRNFINSNIKYLLITSHGTKNISNKEILIGGFRLTNLLDSPFSLPEPDARIKDYIEGYHERYLFLYSRDKLIAWESEL